MSGKALVTPHVVACGVHDAGPSHGEHVRDGSLLSRCIVTHRTAEAAERLFWSHNALNVKNGVIPSANPVTVRSPYASFTCFHLSRFVIDRDVCHSQRSAVFARPTGITTRRCSGVSLEEQESNSRPS
jgi:hypothetical protein